MNDEENPVAVQALRSAALKYEKEFAEKRFELDFKGVGYLLTAHGAGLVGCLAVLKDYASNPQLKGIGIFIACFGVGFVLACLGFVSVQLQHSQVMRVFLDGAPDKDPKWLVYKTQAPIIASGFVLIGTTFALVYKFIAL